MLGLGFLYRKAQATVDNAIAQLVWGLLMVVPLLVAIGFATAAASNYLNRLYEPEIANLIIAGVYTLTAAVMAIVYALRQPETAASVEAKAQEQASTDAAQSGDEQDQSYNTVDRDLMMAALTSAAPYAVRPVIGTLFRNLPVVLAVGVAAFVLTRASQAQTEASGSMSPAE